MIFTYEQCINEYGSDYQIKKRVKAGHLKKLMPGYYSDSQFFSELELINIKYPKAIFTMNSAFYYHDLTDVIPTKFHLATDKDASKISNNKIKQYFIPTEVLKVGLERIKYNGVEISIYNKERMLIEVIRNKDKLPYDYYKEIIGNFREDIYNLDIQAIQEYAEIFPKSRLIIDRLRDEVF